MSTVLLLLAQVTLDVGGAKWIWGEGDAVTFRRSVAFEKAERVTLLIACDNRYELFVNETRIGAGDDWTSANLHTVEFHKGDNAIEIRAVNIEGPAGLLVASSGFVSDESWTAGDSPARVVGKYGDAPWGMQPTGGETSLVLLPERQKPQPVEMTLRPGFRAELVYTVPRWSHGSWISMTEDPDGRLIVADQYGAVYRVTLGEETSVERMEIGAGGAHGLLWAFDSLYLVGEGPQGTGLYRWKDGLKLLKKLPGGGEHGAHAVVCGPDDMLYVVCGNMTELDLTGVKKTFDRYANDWLLPTHLPPSGHNATGGPPGGVIFRTDPDGKEWELLCGGFRNVYDIAFNADGDLFAYDSDMEYDGGCAWYRPTRVCHVLPGADYGWRRGSGKHPEYFADTLGAVVDIGQGSPTGVTFGYGAKFPARYQMAMFINDWTFGRIRAVHLEPRGASYAATVEDFVVGKPLPLTDSLVARDGALYFLVGGRKTQSKLFRVTYVGDESTAPVDARLSPKRPRITDIESAWPHLDSPDRVVRHMARMVVERDRAWREETRPQAVVTLAIAAARLGDASWTAKLDALDLAALPAPVIVEALRAYALAFIRCGATSPGLADRLAAIFPADDLALNHEIARTLVYLKDPRVVAPAMKLMRASQVQEDQMFYADVLRLVRDGWTLDDRRDYLKWINTARFRLKGSDPFDAGGYFAYEGGREFRPYVELIRADALETLTGEERVALADLIDAKAPPAPDPEKLELSRQRVPWTLADLEPALKRVGSARSFRTGRSAYAAVGCAKCHPIGGSTADVDLGPDLSTAGNRYGPRDLLEQILEPSKVIADQYADRTIVTRDGVRYTGAIVSEDERGIVLRPDPAKPATVTIADVAERGISKVSRMPEGLVDFLTEEQILDLLAYVLAGGDAKDPAFRED